MGTSSPGLSSPCWDGMPTCALLPVWAPCWTSAVNDIQILLHVSCLHPTDLATLAPDLVGTRWREPGTWAGDHRLLRSALPGAPPAADSKPALLAGLQQPAQQRAAAAGACRGQPPQRAPHAPQRCRAAAGLTGARHGRPARQAGGAGRAQQHCSFRQDTCSQSVR